MRNNKNEHFQLTLENIEQVTAFEVCDEAEKEAKAKEEIKPESKQFPNIIFCTIKR